MQTMLIIIGVAIGVGVIVFMSALLTGLQANFIRRVLTASAHIVVLPPDEVARPLRKEPGASVIAVVQKPLQRVRSVDQWQKVRAELTAMPGIAVVSPSASGAAFIVRGDANKSITLLGIEPEHYFQIVKVPDYIIAGAPRVTGQDILVGVDLANDLGVSIGDKLRVATVTGNGFTLNIVGIYDLGNRGANSRNVFVALRTAQTLLDLAGGISSLDVTVRDVYAAEAVAKTITASTGLRADSWIKTNAQFFQAVSAQTTANITIRFFVGLSVAFGIASVLVVSVVQKSKEIGILRAMGGSRGQILRVFLVQGGIVGLIGSIVGASLGFGFLMLWSQVARNPDGTPYVPIIYDPMLFVAAAVLATLVGVLAAIMPALSAARLDPVVAIRG